MFGKFHRFLNSPACLFDQQSELLSTLSLIIQCLRIVIAAEPKILYFYFTTLFDINNSTWLMIKGPQNVVVGGVLITKKNCVSRAIDSVILGSLGNDHVTFR